MRINFYLGDILVDTYASDDFGPESTSWNRLLKVGYNTVLSGHIIYVIESITKDNDTVTVQVKKYISN